MHEVTSVKEAQAEMGEAAIDPSSRCRSERELLLARATRPLSCAIASLGRVAL